ncbi:hypothetical protein AZKH_0640 [Azoarcus sp. KH32C]|nr:hypothetical protein AZKH_0640 [Azoarcus sp. KH32C]
MSFFDSPVGRCEVVREMVLLDETQAECAREHGCPRDCNCPLKGYFTEISGVSDPASLPKVRRARRSSKTAASAPILGSPKRSQLKALVFTQEAPLPQRKVA